MKIGIVSPFMPHDLRDLLDPDSQKLLPGIRGIFANPVTPLARTWHQRGHDVSVFCLDPSVSARQVLRGEGLIIYVLPKRRPRRYLMDFYRVETRRLTEAILEQNPDVLSAQWTYEHAWGALQTGIPTAVTCHDTPLRYAWVGKDWFATYHIGMAWRVIQRANRLICVSPYTARHIKKYFFPRCPLDMVPNALRPELFERGKRRMANPEDRKGRPFVFCSAASWGPLKNARTLLKAFGHVRRAEPDAELVLFGREVGPGQAAEQWARRKNLDQGVSFIGIVSTESLMDFLETKADLMVHPSKVETFCMTLVEAIACGVPVIGGDRSGAVAWTLDDGASGFLCNVCDGNALAETMLKAMRQPDHNRGLANRAWQSAKERFDLDAIATANETILKRLLQ